MKEKTALLIIDMEKAFVEEGSAHCIKQAKATVPACAKAVAIARENSIPVFWIKRIYRTDGSDVEFTRREAWEKGGKTLGPNSTGVNSIEEPDGLEIKDGDYVIIKPRWSGFFQTELDLILRRLKIERVVLIGTTTPNCVRTTCYDAIALDYETTIIEDCTSSQTEEIQRVNLQDMERIGAEVLTLEEFEKKQKERKSNESSNF